MKLSDFLDAVQNFFKNVLYLNLTNGSAPGTPESGTTSVYAKTDKSLAFKDDAGNESVIATTARGKLIQRVVKTSADLLSTSGKISFVVYSPNVGAGALAISQAFTPKSTNNRLFIRFSAPLIGSNAAALPVVLAMFSGSTLLTSGLFVTSPAWASGSYTNGQGELVYDGTIASLASQTITVRFGIEQDTSSGGEDCYLNQIGMIGGSPEAPASPLSIITLTIDEYEP